jgi:hypothetical protein
MRMLEIVRTLPEAYRETLVLRLVEGMTGDIGVQALQFFTELGDILIRGATVMRAVRSETTKGAFSGRPTMRWRLRVATGSRTCGSAPWNTRAAISAMRTAT